MIQKPHGYDVVVDFWEWYQRRQERRYNPLASHALDKCEHALASCDWDSFAFWHKIYLRERSKCQPPRQIH